MNRKYKVLFGMSILFLLAVCSVKTTEKATEKEVTVVTGDTATQSDGDTNTTLPNPMTETTLEEINKLFPVQLSDEMLDVKCFFIEAEGAEPMAEINFTYQEDQYCYRIQSTSQLTDISGMFFDWAQNEKATIGYNEGEALFNEGKEGIINWYDAAPGLMYSIGMETGASLDKLETMANLLYTPAQGEN